MGFFGWVFIANPAWRLVSSASRLAAARVWSSSCASMLAFAATYYDSDKKNIYLFPPNAKTEVSVDSFFLGGGGGGSKRWGES